MPQFSLDLAEENPDYLSRQLITYIGNKRALLHFIGQGLELVRRRLGKHRLSCFDVFSGSGVVARFLKRYADRLLANDLETYSWIINSCYLTNASAVNRQELEYWFVWLRNRLTEDSLAAGFISELYAPKDEHHIKRGERCFYTPRNARYIDTARQLISELPPTIQHFFIAPLLAAASIHANTAGVFKGFYKDGKTGTGQYGGRNRDAQKRILGNIELELPIFSKFDAEVTVYKEDANQLIGSLEEVDLAYLDPPYNEHPYGSNYFMLNVIAEYRRPTALSPVSGIPPDWHRSVYNKRQEAYRALSDLVEGIRAKYLLLSFNSEGHITLPDMVALLERIGKTEVLETRYNTFRGSRNLHHRPVHVTEYLYLVEKR
ncbi:MAG: DNA adenine methylase [Termitinemataceae bacterium]